MERLETLILKSHGIPEELHVGLSVVTRFVSIVPGSGVAMSEWLA